MAQTAGPLLGGGLVSAVGAPLAFLADAVSFAASGLLVAVTRVRGFGARLLVEFALDFGM